MKTEDCIKTMAIVSGYDRNITFDKWRIHDVPGEWCYKFSAQNEFGDVIHICEQGIGNAISKLMLEIFSNNQHIFNHYINVPTSKFLDDGWRNTYIDARAVLAAEVDEFIEKTKPVNDWWKLNNPCIGCTINRKDIYDPIHYHCKLNHTHQCEILNEAFKEYEKRMNECSNNLYKHLKSTYNDTIKTPVYNG